MPVDHLSANSQPSTRIRRQGRSALAGIRRAAIEKFIALFVMTVARHLNPKDAPSLRLQACQWPSDGFSDWVVFNGVAGSFLVRTRHARPGAARTLTSRGTQQPYPPRNRLGIYNMN